MPCRQTLAVVYDPLWLRSARTDSTMIRSGRPWGRLKGSFRSSSAVTGASTSRRQGIIKPPHFVLQPLSTVWRDALPSLFCC
ncbi:hypothetical protein [Desulforamulus hydrothermalis]|uniref:hypothetical protein n=1 Tax=Desulforamulus hydrothermalis TaxID=412895 RepID=UPI0015BB344D|nr:hypothetical protein [Desulforamulus hydrothermalis]